MINGASGRSVLAACLCADLLVGGRAVASDQLLATIRDANKNSIEMIRTLHATCKFTQAARTEGGASVPLTEKSIEWWQDGNLVRWVEETRSVGQAPKKGGGAQRKEGVINAAGEVKMIHRSRGADGKWTVDGGGIRPVSRDKMLTSDVWALANLVVLPTPRCTLADLLSDPKAVKSVTSFREDGKLRHRVVVQAPAPVSQYQFDVVVDPSHNYLVTSSAPTTTSPKEVVRIEKKVLSFLECDPGIYFPKVVETTTFAVTPEKETRVISVTRTTFQSVVVNRPIDPALFNLEFAPGTAILDERDQTRYVVGADQQPVGPVQPAPVAVAVLAKPTYMEEPRPWSWWVIAGCGLACIGAVGVGWRLRRRSR